MNSTSTATKIQDIVNRLLGDDASVVTTTGNVASLAGCSYPTAARALKALVAAGSITTTSKRGRAGGIIIARVQAAA